VPDIAAPTPGGPSRDTSASSADLAPRPASREPEARAIEGVLGRYRQAFNTLDISATTAVWPSVDEKTLARAFDRLEDQEVSFETCEIDVAGVLAEAACSGSARYVPKVGSRTARAEARRWSFTLRKAGGGWVIDRVTAR
jgi:hypothetical protein